MHYGELENRELGQCLAFTGFRTGPGKPGKSWNFIEAFSRAGKSWKVLEIC